MLAMDCRCWVPDCNVKLDHLGKYDTSRHGGLQYWTAKPIHHTHTYYTVCDPGCALTTTEHQASRLSTIMLWLIMGGIEPNPEHIRLTNLGTRPTCFPITRLALVTNLFSFDEYCIYLCIDYSVVCDKKC